jgi:transposase
MANGGPRTNHAPDEGTVEHPGNEARSVRGCEFDDEGLLIDVAPNTVKRDAAAAAGVMRFAWSTVGSIAERVVKRLSPEDRLIGLRKVGIHELSYRRHHEYVTSVAFVDS